MTIWIKTSHVCIQTEISFIAHLIATINNYAYSLLPLANIDWSASPECFFLTMLIHNWWNGQNKGLQLGRGDLILLPLLAHVCPGLVVEYWLFVGACGCHSHSKLYQSVILLLCFSLCHHLPPYSSRPPFLVYINAWRLIEMFSSVTSYKSQYVFNWVAFQMHRNNSPTFVSQPHHFVTTIYVNIHILRRAITCSGYQLLCLHSLWGTCKESCEVRILASVIFYHCVSNS